MYTYEIEIGEKTFFLTQWEKGMRVKNTSEKFSDNIIAIHPLQNFFKEAKTGVKEIKFKNINFNILDCKCNNKEKIMFTTDADFDTVAKTLVRFKNKYKVSLTLLRNTENNLHALHGFLKVEYVQHFDKPNGNFLTCRNFYSTTLNITKSYKVAYFLDMLMTFYYGEKEYEGIFLDTESENDMELDINKKVFFNVYTDKTIKELADYCVESYIDSPEDCKDEPTTSD